HVALRTAHAQLEVRDALQAEAYRRASRRVLVAGLPDTAIGAQARRVLLHEVREMLGADLLLALEQDADTQRELAHRRAIRLDRLKPRHEVAFVVGDAAAEEHPVALDRLERRGLPLVLGIRGLDVVMVVDEERAGAGPGLADDRRRPGLRAQRLRRDTGTSCAREHRRGGLVDRALVSGHRRQTDERL